MKPIYCVCILIMLFFSCQKKIENKNCNIELINNNKYVNNNCEINIIFSLKENKISISYTPTYDKLVFNPPKIIFGLQEKKMLNNEEQNIVIKEKINNISFFKKDMMLIGKHGIKKSLPISNDNLWNRKITLLKNEKLIQEFFVDCENSDVGLYKIYFVSKSHLNNKIRFPDNYFIIKK